MTQATDVQIAICGSAGDGTIAAGDILKRAMAKSGYRVIAFDQYPAEIRGFGKCVARTRFTTDQVYSIKRRSDVLVSLNDGHAIPHVEEVRDFGAVIYDSAPMSTVAEGEHIAGHLHPGQLPYTLPIRELSEQATGAARSRNIVALGFVAGLYRLPREGFLDAISTKFQTKPASVTETNLKAFDIGYDAGLLTYRFDKIDIGPPRPGAAKKDFAMMTGNGAVVRGCVDAGIDTFFGYPITPATSIMERLALEMPKRGARLLQTEDEISAISATIGAGFAGSRAATATSGPGLALMAEMLGLGVMTEVPAVVFVSQRGGPSTGLPTKTEQSDLNAAVFGGHGDAKRIVLAPTNVEGCWKCAGKAFELAEAYQVPVIVLLDLYLSNRYETVVFPEKESFLRDVHKKMRQDQSEPYRRYEMVIDGISPRAIPGQDGGIYTATGLEHTEFGRPSDQSRDHRRMSHKRHHKLATAVKYPEITITKRFGHEGKVDVGVLSWGSTFGEVLEAIAIAQSEGISCAAMKVVMLSPLPVEAVQAFFNDCGEILVPELNYEGQFANLICGTIGRPVTRLNRVTGKPMEVEEILAAIRTAAQDVQRRSSVA